MGHDLEEIEKAGSRLFTIKETSILLDIPEEEFVDEQSDVYKAYYKGFLRTEFEIREEIIDSAKAGSPAAQETVNRLIQSVKSSNQKNG